MSRQVFLVLALTGMLSVSAAYGHDARLHKGKPTVGKVVSLADNGVTLQTAHGTTAVTFQDKTKFERGEAQASSQEIQPGDQLTVFGTKLPSGELVAREVLLPTTGAKGETHTHHSAHQAERR
jgi:hypothetical protein